MSPNFATGGDKFPIADSTDVGETALYGLVNLKFTGRSVRYIASDEVSTGSIAQTVSRAIGPG